MTERDPSQRVVITGMGMVSPVGIDTKSSYEALKAGNHGIENVRDSLLNSYSKDVISTSLAARVKDFDIGTLLGEAGFDKKTVRSIARESGKRIHGSAEFSLWSSVQALRQAKLLPSESLKIDGDQVDPTRFGVFVGTGIGGATTLEEVRRVIDKVSDDRLSPYDILKALPGRVDEVPSIILNAKAISDTVGTECAAGLSAMGYAVDYLRLGRADVMLAGGVEGPLTPSTLAAFEATRALHQSTDADQAPRPLEDPDGLVMGEGSAMVVLETLEYAKWRNKKLGGKVTAFAEVLGVGGSADAYHPTFPSEDGAIRAINSAHKEAGTDPAEQENVVIPLHATGTGGDILEVKSTSKIYSPSQVLGMYSVKGYVGHMLGGAGGANVVPSVLAANENLVLGNRISGTPLSRLDEDVLETFPEIGEWQSKINSSAYRVERIDLLQVHAFGFGGKNRVALLGNFGLKL